MKLFASSVSPSILQKVVLLTCSMTFLACLLVGAFTFSRLYETTINKAMAGLASEAEMVAVKFQESYMQMENDAFILQHTPPIRGIMRSQESGSDPLDGSTDALWRQRLATIFISIMVPRAHYTQMRYIGLAHNGQELVRVNRTERGFEIVPSGNLQEKANEPYFQQGLHLKPEEVAFSDITFNREYGKQDGEGTPTLRVITPVFQGNQLFGMVVINAHFRLLLEQAFQAADPSHQMLVFNHNGDYATYNPINKTVTVSLTEDPNHKPMPKLDELAAMPEKSKMIDSEGVVSAFVKLELNKGDPSSFLGIALQVPKKTLLAQAHQTQTEVLLLALAILAASLLVAGVVARRIIHPLQHMTRSITENTSGKPEDLNLPTERQDEIGDLARAFYRLMANLRKSEVKARGIDSLVDGVITINSMGTIESFNPACEKIFGYTAKEAIGQNIKMLMPDNYRKKHDDYLARYRQTGFKQIIGMGREVSGLRKDNTEFPMELSVSETKTGTGLVFTGVVRDITERKQVERMKDEFVSTVNHELRTPLTSIQASLGLLKVRSAQNMGQKERRLLELSYDNCNRLAHLVNDILDIEKIAAGKMEYLLEEVDICALTADVVERHLSLGEQYGVRFMVNMETADITCKVDCNRFNQALSNLLSNAAKFSPSGEIVTIKVSVEEEGQVVIISVSDNGPGIPENFRTKIFHKFAQADSSSTRAKGGSGLGLNISKSIIEAFGGTITFETMTGIGTTFRMWLPVCNVHPSTTPSSTNKQELHA